MITKKALNTVRRIITGLNTELSYWREFESKLINRKERYKRRKREAFAEKFKASGYTVDEIPYRIDYCIDEYMEGGVCKASNDFEVKHFFRIYTLLGSDIIMVNYINEATHEDIKRIKASQVKMCIDTWVHHIILGGQYDKEAGIKED